MIIYHLRKLLHIPKYKPLSPKDRKAYNEAENDFTAEGAPVPVNLDGPDLAEQKGEPTAKSGLGAE